LIKAMIIATEATTDPMVIQGVKIALQRSRRLSSRISSGVFLEAGPATV